MRNGKCLTTALPGIGAALAFVTKIETGSYLFPTNALAVSHRRAPQREPTDIPFTSPPHCCNRLVAATFHYPEVGRAWPYSIDTTIASQRNIETTRAPQVA